MGSLEWKLARRRARKLIGHKRKFTLLFDDAGNATITKRPINLPKKVKKK